MALCLLLASLVGCAATGGEDGAEDGSSPASDDAPATGDPTTGDPTAGDPTEGETDAVPTPEAICDAADPSTDATVIVDDSQWPNVPDGELDPAIEFEVPCTITAVDPLASPVVTDLECLDGEQTRPLQITLPAHPEPVAWTAGDEVTVAYHRLIWPDGYGSLRDDLTMRRADDGALLLAKMNQEAFYPDTFSPLQVTLDEDRCAPEGAFEETWNVVLTFDDGAGETIDLSHFQRSSIAALVGNGRLTIDVGEARYGEAYCCHASRGLEILVRRTLE